MSLNYSRVHHLNFLFTKHFNQQKHHLHFFVFFFKQISVNQFLKQMFPRKNKLQNCDHITCVNNLNSNEQQNKKKKRRSLIIDDKKKFAFFSFYNNNMKLLYAIHFCCDYKNR